MGNYCLFHSMFAYFILALISMNMRILSGFLFLIASIITLPLVLLFVTLIIPIFFFIIAIMMFARKSKVETVPMYGPSQGYEPHYYPRDEYNDYDDRYYGSNRNINDDYGYDNHNQYDDYEQDDVEPPHKTKNQTVVHVVKPYYNDDIDNNYRDNNFDDTTHRNDAEQDLATDTEEDKYNQYPKRAITDEYHTDANENEELAYFLDRLNTIRNRINNLSTITTLMKIQMILLKMWLIQSRKLIKRRKSTT